MLTPLTQVFAGRRPIRPVHRDLEFYELKDAMEQQGQLVPLLVRPWKGGHEVIDGHRRLVVADLLGWDEIDVTSRGMTDKDVLIAQIRLNSLSVEETRVAILQLHDAFSLDKVPDIGYALGRNVDWIGRILGFDGLSEAVKKGVNHGWIDVKVAMLLAKLSKGRQRELLSDALSNPPDLIPRLQTEVRHRWEDKLSRRIVKKATGPYLRSEREILSELNKPLNAMTHLTKEEITTPFDAWKAALRWALRLDFESLQERNLNE